VFDVPAIRGENAGRLIPESLEDTLARFLFSPGKKYLARDAAEHARARARIKRLFNRRCAVLT
jgi:hypothetical protein